MDYGGLCPFIKKTICQLPHVTSENVCQYLLALFVQLHKYNIHLVLFWFLHKVQAGELLPGNGFIF